MSFKRQISKSVQSSAPIRTIFKIQPKKPAESEKILTSQELEAQTKQSAGLRHHLSDINITSGESVAQSQPIKRLVAQPLFQPPQLQQDSGSIIQRAWTGRRQLGEGTLNTVLGKPWVWRTKGNLLNWGGYHEHIFFEDGKTPPDIGHLGKQGLGQDTARVNEYAPVRTKLNDERMRRAVAQINVQPGEYSLLSNNCQMYVQNVLKIYEQSE